MVLSWSFDSNERNNTGSIEKSTDGMNFRSILQKEYINNSPSQQTFNDNMIDEAAFKGKNYYRLKTTGQDGQVKYSAVQLINIDNDFSVQVEPNPVKINGELKVIVSGGPASKILFNIYDLAGKQIQSETFTNAGINTVHIKAMSTGTYLYKLIYENRSVTGKIVVNGN